MIFGLKSCPLFLFQRLSSCQELSHSLTSLHSGKRHAESGDPSDHTASHCAALWKPPRSCDTSNPVGRGVRQIKTRVQRCWKPGMVFVNTKEFNPLNGSNSWCAMIWRLENSQMERFDVRTFPIDMISNISATKYMQFIIDF